MKKIFTFIACVAMAMAANAQSITFGEVAVDNANLPAAWEEGGVKLTLVKDEKPTIDLSKSKFGTAEDSKEYISRLKTGGKSNDSRYLTLTVPAKGTVKIAARTGKNADNTRTIVLTQNGTELVNKALDEAEAIDKVYPYVTAEVLAGDIVITFPVNGINIYGIEFVAESGTGAGINNIAAGKQDGKTYDLSGHQVGQNYKGVVIKDGKKYIK